MAEHGIAALTQEYMKLRGVEQSKNLLIEVDQLLPQRLFPPADEKQELLRRHDTLTEEYEREKLDHDRESQFNRDVQLREQRLQTELRACKDLMVSFLHKLRQSHIVVYTANEQWDSIVSP